MSGTTLRATAHVTTRRHARQKSACAADDTQARGAGRTHRSGQRLHRDIHPWAVATNGRQAAVRRAPSCRPPAPGPSVPSRRGGCAPDSKASARSPQRRRRVAAGPGRGSNRAGSERGASRARVTSRALVSRAPGACPRQLGVVLPAPALVGKQPANALSVPMRRRPMCAARWYGAGREPTTGGRARRPASARV